jgi:hypothetical protein
MELDRDLCLTATGVLCEWGSPEAAFVFHRKGQLVTPMEDAHYGVTAYLERTRRDRERAERQRVLAALQPDPEEKAVEQAETEDKALRGPHGRFLPRTRGGEEGG